MLNAIKQNQQLVSDSRYVSSLYYPSEFVAKKGFCSDKTLLSHRLSCWLPICRIDVDKSAVSLENECYKKYGKSGKSFYLSLMASTARWLSTAGPKELVNKLSSSTPENVTSTANCSTALSNPSMPVSPMVNDEKVHDNAGSEDPTRPSVSPLHGSASSELPPILSFSQFINSGKAKGNSASVSKRDSPDTGKKNLEKRMRSQ